MEFYFRYTETRSRPLRGRTPLRCGQAIETTARSRHGHRPGTEPVRKGREPGRAHLPRHRPARDPGPERLDLAARRLQRARTSPAIRATCCPPTRRRTPRSRSPRRRASARSRTSPSPWPTTSSTTPRKARRPDRDRGVRLGPDRGRRLRRTTTPSSGAAPEGAPPWSRPMTAATRRVWVVSGLQGSGHPQDDRVGILGIPQGRVHDPAGDRRPHPGDLADRPVALRHTRCRLGTRPTRHRRTMLERFAEVYSLALQQTLYAMGEAVLEAHPEVAEIKFWRPNKHHFLVDLSPFGVENHDEVFFAADRPYGLIEAAVRDDATAPGGLVQRPRLLLNARPPMTKSTSATTTNRVRRQASGRRGPAGPQTRHLRLPARAGVLRRRGDGADPAGRAIGLTERAADPPDQRRPVHLRHRLDHPVGRLLEGRRQAAAAAGRDLHRGLADDRHRRWPPAAAPRACCTSTARSSSPGCSPSSSRRTSPS